MVRTHRCGVCMQLARVAHHMYKGLGTLGMGMGAVQPGGSTCCCTAADESCYVARSSHVLHVWVRVLHAHWHALYLYAADMQFCAGQHVHLMMFGCYQICALWCTVWCSKPFHAPVLGTQEPMIMRSELRLFPAHSFLIDSPRRDCLMVRD
jgi:hypothetical protein